MSVSRRTFVSTLAAGAGLLAAPGLLRAQGRVLRFATEGAYPPFNQTSPNGAITGFEPELVQALSERQGFKFELISQAWDGMIQGLIDGKYDAVVDAVTITPARMEVIDFSLPYTSGGSAFATTTESGLTLPMSDTRVDLSDEAGSKPAIDAVVEALDGKSVGVQVSTIQSGFLDTYLAPRGVTIRAYQAGPEAYQDLLNGRVDAVMAAVTNMSAFLKRNEGDAAMSGPIFGGGLMGNGAAVAIAKGSDLAPMFDEGLRAMSADGSLTELSMKWFGLDVTPKL